MAGDSPEVEAPLGQTTSTTALERAIWMARWSVVVCVLLGAAIVVVELVIGEGMSKDEIEGFVAEFGLVAPIGFVIAFAILGSLLVPTTLLAVIGATLFGPAVGFAYSMVGAFIAAMLGFGAARTAARRAVSKWLNAHRGRISRLDARLERRGFTTALFMRLLYLPNGLINVVCGLSAIPSRVYAVATLLGLLPMVFAVSFVAGGAREALLAGNWAELWQPETVASAALFVACVTTPFIAGAVKRRLGARRMLGQPFEEISGVFEPVEASSSPDGD